MLLMPLPAMATVADAYEPDDSYTTATPITVGAVAQQHTLAPEGDEDWVSFSVSAGEIYWIETAPGTPVEHADTILELYDSDGITLIDSDDDGGADLYSRIEYTSDTNETLYAKVIGFSSATGTYSISVAVRVPTSVDGYEPDDSYTTATPITVGAVSQQHTLAPEGDEDWISFSVSAGVAYRIKTASGIPAEDIGVSLGLYDSDGTTPLTGSGNGIDPDEQVVYTATADTTLYAQVAAYYSGETGAYSISVERVGDSYEPDDSYDTASPITVDAAPQQHTLDPQDDQDWVSFDVAEGRTYRVSSGVEWPDDFTRTTLYDSDGSTEIGLWTGSDTIAEYTADADKTVYARVTGYWADEGAAYEVSVVELSDDYEPDDIYTAANPIAVGGASQQHNIAPADDQDWVSFEVAAGLTYRVACTADAQPAEFTRTALFDSDGVTELVPGEFVAADTFLEYKADEDKTVYARITGYLAFQEEEYEVSAVVISDDYEPDDSHSAAKPLAVNGSVQERTLLPSDDEDWVSIPVIRGWRYTIETGPGTPLEDTDTILDLYDSDGTTLIDSYDHGGEGEYSRIEYTAKTDKTVYARVTGGWLLGSTYTLWATAIPIPMISVTQNMDFGTVMVGSSTQRTITVSNVGAAPLDIGEVRLVGADFSIASGNPSGETIAPDESHDVVVRYSPTIAYSGEPVPVKTSYTSTIARYNYVEGHLDSISLFTGFENRGGGGDLAWHVRIDGVDYTGSGAVVSGGKYVMEVVESYSMGSGLVEVLEPVTQGFELEDLLGEFRSVAYIRVADAALQIGSNDSEETTVSVGLFGTAGEAAVDVTPPTVPQGVSAHAVSSTAIQVSWSASIDASGIKHYLVYDAATNLLKATVTGTTATISGLTPSTSYSYYVKAVDNAPAANTSGASANAPATTLAPPDVVAPVITVSGVTNGGTYTSPVTITFSALDAVDGPVLAEATLDSVAFTSGSSVSALGVHTLVVTAEDTAGNPATKTVVFTISEVPPPLVVTPIQGANRIGTAIAAAEESFPTGAGAVVIATAYNWPDALGGAALAGALNAPILLTPTAALPAEVLREIEHLGATKAYILGWTPSVSTAVENALKGALGAGNVTRIWGANRYETARAIAAKTIDVLDGSYDGTCFIATGVKFPDALGASPLAAANGWPIYLVNPTAGLDAATRNAMASGGVDHPIVLGSTAAIPAGVETALNGIYGSLSVDRLYGANRYSTAVAVAVYGVDHAELGWDKVAFATGTNFPDALAGGVLQGRDSSVMLLTPGTALDSTVRSTLVANKAAINEVRYLGSTAAVSQVVRDAVEAALAR